MANSKRVKVGRPKRFTPEFIADLIPKLETWCKKKSHFWLGDFAIENGFWRDALNDFAAESEEFARALKKAQTVQESRLIKLGLKANVKPTMAIFALKNVAGWRDEQPQQIPAQYFNIVIGQNGQDTNGRHVTIGKQNNGRGEVAN